MVLGWRLKCAKMGKAKPLHKRLLQFLTRMISCQIAQLFEWHSHICATSAPPHWITVFIVSDVCMVKAIIKLGSSSKMRLVIVVFIQPPMIFIMWAKLGWVITTCRQIGREPFKTITRSIFVVISSSIHDPNGDPRFINWIPDDFCVLWMEAIPCFDTTLLPTIEIVDP